MPDQDYEGLPAMREKDLQGVCNEPLDGAGAIQRRGQHDAEKMRERSGLPMNEDELVKQLAEKIAKLQHMGVERGLNLRTEIIEKTISEAIRETRKATLEEAAAFVKSRGDEFAVAKNLAGNCDTGRALQKGVWALFAIETELRRLAEETK